MGVGTGAQAVHCRMVIRNPGLHPADGGASSAPSPWHDYILGGAVLLPVENCWLRCPPLYFDVTISWIPGCVLFCFFFFLMFLITLNCLPQSCQFIRLPAEQKNAVSATCASGHCYPAHLWEILEQYLRTSGHGKWKSPSR